MLYRTKNEYHQLCICSLKICLWILSGILIMFACFSSFHITFNLTCFNIDNNTGMIELTTLKLCDVQKSQCISCIVYHAIALFMLVLILVTSIIFLRAVDCNHKRCFPPNCNNKGLFILFFLLILVFAGFMFPIMWILLEIIGLICAEIYFCLTNIFSGNFINTLVAFVVVLFFFDSNCNYYFMFNA